MYRCEAVSIEGFIQQLAVAYLARGYWFYVAGTIPTEKDPRRTDARILAKYGIGISKYARARRKRSGLANVHYLRHGRFFVLLASHGVHEFFEQEGHGLRDAREVPIQAFGYSVSVGCRRTTAKPVVRVRIQREQLEVIRDHFMSIALRWDVGPLVRAISSLPFEPYAPVRRQLGLLVRAINQKRVQAGLERLPWSSLRLWRRVASPFAEVTPEVEARWNRVRKVSGSLLGYYAVPAGR